MDLLLSYDGSPARQVPSPDNDSCFAMPSEVLHFPPFLLDRASQLLKRGDETVHLEPKAWELLCRLAERAGQVITKNELLTLVWPEAVVSEGSLTRVIGLLRSALGDDARSPRFIETVHRRGFRFVAEVSADGVEARDSTVAAPAIDESIFVGRAPELRQLAECLEAARLGRRRLVLVGGEAGIGKTSLIRRFLAEIPAGAPPSPIWLASGQCIQQHGAGEAYMPVLAALGQLGRGPQGSELAEVLRAHAPSWLVQLPGLVSQEESDRIRATLAGTGSGRMLREIAGALEVLTARRTLVLVLEDLHWSDRATLDFLTAIASHPGQLRLLVLGVYRPVDAILLDHPLRRILRSLEQHPESRLLHLDPLSPEDIADYCRGRFPNSDLGPETVAQMHARTAGNALFLVALVDHLMAGGWLATRGGHWHLDTGLESIAEVPESVRQMIETQIEALSETDQGLLETAAVGGIEFAVDAVAAALAGDSETSSNRVDADCHRLARHWRLLREVESCDWPDGTRAARYAFSHALYQQVLYERVPSGRRARLHQRIGERLETGHGGRTRDVAAELAAHFQASGDHARALAYLWEAAAALGQRFVGRDAYLVPALHHLALLPESMGRDYQELLLRLNLGMGRFAREGFTAEGVEENLDRAEDLCDRIEGGGEIDAALFGLWVCRMFAGRRDRARALEAKIAQRAAVGGSWLLSVGSAFTGAATSFFEGQFAAVRTLLEAVPADALQNWHEEDAQTTAQIGFSGADPVVAFLGFASWNLWVTGYPDQARSSMDQALLLAEGSANPFTVGGIQFAAAMLGMFSRQPDRVRPLARQLLAKGVDQDFLSWRVGGEFLEGWVDLSEGDAGAVAARLRRLLSDDAVAGVAFGACGSLALSILADACIASDELDEGLATIERALRHDPHRLRGHWDAELQRQRGDLLLRMQQGADAEGRAEAAFREAIETARGQEAKMLELRATASLSRLLAEGGRAKEAYEALAPICRWFTEGFETIDLKEATDLLEALRP